nr:response regulator [Vicinamibacterales bacterium]
MPPKILLADDSVTVQKVIELTFSDEGIQVVAVGDGRQAIDRLATERPDIVLADVSMPERDGYAVAEFVKGTADYRHIPVVLMTGAFEQLDEARARAVGCDGVLAKPFEPQMVVTLVRELLAKAAGDPAAGAGRAAIGYPFDPGAAPAPATPTLDDYFDRIDDATSAPPAPPLAAPFAAEADADTLITSQAPAVPPGVADDVVAPVAPPVPDAAQPEAATGSPLANAFSAILADELGEAPLPASWAGFGGGGAAQALGPEAPAPDAPVVTDALVDEVARRVVERLSVSLVRE